MEKKYDLQKMNDGSNFFFFFMATIGLIAVSLVIVIEMIR